MRAREYVARALEKAGKPTQGPRLLFVFLRRGILRPPAFLPSCGDVGSSPALPHDGPGLWAHHPTAIPYRRRPGAAAFPRYPVRTEVPEKTVRGLWERVRECG